MISATTSLYYSMLGRSFVSNVFCIVFINLFYLEPNYTLVFAGPCRYQGQCCGSGSGIRCLFTPRIRDNFFSGSRISDPGSWILTTSQIQDFTFKNGEKQEKLGFV
jgi:hypothetical protein